MGIEILEIWSNHCCALNEYVSHRLRHLKTLSPIGCLALCLASLGGLPGGSMPLGDGLSEVKASAHPQPQFALSDSCLQLEM